MKLFNILLSASGMENNDYRKQTLGIQREMNVVKVNPLPSAPNSKKEAEQKAAKKLLDSIKDK